MTKAAASAWALALALGLVAGGTVAARAMATSAPRPVVLGHRGASALRPEHTLASYAQAVADGADYIEPDLVVTKDGVLVVRHENDITETTDVAAHPEFVERRTEKTIDGERHVGWFTEDFTLAELKTLRAKERLPALRPVNAAMDGRFDIVTWQEVVDYAAAETLAPELKHSTYFRSIGLPLEDRFLESLRTHWITRTAPIIVQSFEVENLRYLRRKLGRPANIRLMQLVAGTPAGARPADGGPSYAAMTSPEGLRRTAAYADILAPDTRSIIPLRADGRLAPATPLVARAHAAGLAVMPWTFRPENHFLAADFRNSAGDAARNEAGSIAEMRAYLATGIDGLFTDDPALARAALRQSERDRPGPIPADRRRGAAMPSAERRARLLG
jgi:glycerophosphoryl diester phosphodiesterase